MESQEISKPAKGDSPISSKPRIYQDTKLELLPDFYDRDILKVLIRNPREAFAFWAVSTETLKNMMTELKATQEEIHYKLIVQYNREDKHLVEFEVLLEPFTSTYLIKFQERIHNLKVEFSGFTKNGEYFVLFHSSILTLPPNQPSNKVSKEWLNPNWYHELGLVEESSGEPIAQNKFEEIWKEQNVSSHEEHSEDYISKLPLGSSENYKPMGSSENYSSHSLIK